MDMQSPPFPRGGLAGYDPADPSGATFLSTADSHLLGMEWDFPDLNYGSAHETPRSNRKVRCRAVRNTSGGALLGKRAVEWDASAASVYYGNNFNGYAEAGDAGGILDEFLPSTGCPSNAICWAVVEGPTKWTNDATSTFAIGDHVNPTTDGKALLVTPSGTAATIFGQGHGIRGRAMEASGPAAGDMLVDIAR